MRGWLAFWQKEWRETMRSGKGLILLIMFALFGLMNPAIAKLTPLLFDLLSDSLANTGMVIEKVDITALQSWEQFFKNIPMALIAFVLLTGGSLVKEAESGTLMTVLTRGFARYKLILCKTLHQLILWSMSYWLCFVITYGYNTVYWDNSTVPHLLSAVIGWWIFGLWICTLTMLFSAISTSLPIVLLGTGGSALLVYLLSLLPKIGQYLPGRLLSTAAIYGQPADGIIPACVLTLLLSIGSVITAVFCMNRKEV